MEENLYCRDIQAQHLEQIKDWIECIAAGKEPEAEEALKKLNAFTGKQYDKEDFLEYWGWTDLHSLAQSIVQKPPHRLHGISLEQATELVCRIQNALCSGEEKQMTYYMQLLQESLPGADVLAVLNLEESAESIAKELLQSAQAVILLRHSRQ